MSLQAGMELQSGLMNSMYATVSSMNMISASLYELQGAMKFDLDTSSVEYLQNHLEQAMLTLDEMNSQQMKLNGSMQDGTVKAGALTRAIERTAASYINMQSAGKVLNVSDEMTQTTARIAVMNDGMQTTDKLMEMIYDAAQDSRSSFADMANVVAGFGSNSGEVFGSTREAVAFTELIQKQMTLAGASSAEASNAMLQLSKGLGTGALHGDELNAVFEQAPNLIQNIADYLGVSTDQITAMTSEGQISAEVLKNAIFAASDEINAQFEQMPMTWGQIWQSMKNDALIAFGPMLQQLNEFANSEEFQMMQDRAVTAISKVANVVGNMFDLITKVGGFMCENWSMIEPFIWGGVVALGGYIAAFKLYSVVQGITTMAEKIHAATLMRQNNATFDATVKQHGFNAALAACPLTKTILLIITLVSIIIAVASTIAQMTGVANSGFGIVAGGINVVGAFFRNLGLSIINIVLGLGNAMSVLCSNMMSAFHNALCSIQSWFYDLLSTGISVIAEICESLNKLPFVSIDYSGIENAADEYAAKAAEAAENKEEYQSIKDAFDEGYNTFDTFRDGWISDAFNAGAEWSDGIADMLTSLDIPGTGNGESPLVQQTVNGSLQALDSNSETIADNTDAIAEGMETSQEELRYLRDLAEQEAVNRFTIAEVKIEQTNHNNVSSGMDLDGVVIGLTDAVNEAADMITEGVHA